MDTVHTEIACMVAGHVADHFGYKANGFDGEDGPNKFWRFVGFRADVKRDFNHETGLWTLPDNIARRIKLLAGPHHQTVIRAMIANGASIKVRRTNDYVSNSVSC